MNPRLSIIIPCYNCERTLREAVVSCYAQGLMAGEFEIVMVDDGSKDTTRTLMEQLSKEYPSIRLFFHEANRGGGATRNTGIKEALGTLIFCLDSDNFFPPQTLRKMIDYIDRKHCDGVVIYDRRFFVGTNTKKYTSHFNTIVHRSLLLQDIFVTTKEAILIDNFLFTKKAYLEAGGYPEHHGFDTQCFEIRFLATNHSVYVCPDATFYHRQSASADSYFQRVYKEGLFSRNFYLICEDVFHLFSKETQMLIVKFDIFRNTKLDSHNLKATLDTAYERSPETFFIPDKETYMTENGSQLLAESLSDSSEPADIFYRALYAYKQCDYKLALEELNALLELGVDSKIIYFNIVRASMALSGKYQHSALETEVARLIESMAPQKQKLNPLMLSLTTLYVRMRTLLTFQ